MHTERLVPVDDGDGGDAVQPHSEPVSGEQQAVEDQQQTEEKGVENEVEEDIVEVHA